MKYNILVIDESNSGLKERIVSALAKEGFEAVINGSSEEALSKLDELRPQLIVLGEGLPIDSFEACYQLRRQVDVPILMVGAVPSERAWIRAVEVEADFYLVKPFSYLELVARVKALIRRYEQSKERITMRETDRVEA